MKTHNPDQQPLDSFDAALLGQLRAEVVRRSAQEERRQPARRLGFAAAGIAATAAAVLGLTTLGSSAAYAVDDTGTGDVQITIHRLDDAAGLEKALASHGIKAHVDYRALDEANGPAGGPEVTTQESGELPSGSIATGEGTATATVPDGRSGAATGTSPCGDPADPALTTAMNADDYVITIPTGSPLYGSDSELRITTSGDLKESVAAINVDYTIDGSRCALGTVSAGTAG